MKAKGALGLLGLMCYHILVERFKVDCCLTLSVKKLKRDHARSKKAASKGNDYGVEAEVEQPGFLIRLK